MNASDVTRAAAGRAVFSGVQGSLPAGCVPFCGGGGAGLPAIASPLGIRSDASGCQLAFPCGYASASGATTGGAVCGYIPIAQYTSTTTPKVCPVVSYNVPLKR
jgi:hypothetical protein